MSLKKPVTAVIIGCGGRGKDAYAPMQEKFPNTMKIVAIADLVAEKRDEMHRRYNVPVDKCFESGELLLEHPKLADVAFICTQDRQHVPHALAALQKGYDLVLEKPISPELDECREILKVANELNRKVIVCHVLRYTPFYKKIKSIIDSGVIGNIVSIQAIENVGYWHTAHSFVRGNWRCESETSPMILAKSCHDMDILLWLMGKPCNRVSSFGSKMVFKPENAPKGAAKRCMDGCAVKESCIYDAEKIYITNKSTGIAHENDNWPCCILEVYPTVENITENIKHSQYGRCVYHCDNDVVDHQTLIMEMNDGSTIDFTMSGFTSKMQRFIKIMGTLGDIEGDMNTNIIDLCEFGKEHELIDVNKLTDDFSGHGGGDSRMIEEFFNMLTGESEPSNSLSTLDVSVESHYVALAAEQSRKNNGESIPIDKMRLSM